MNLNEELWADRQYPLLVEFAHQLAYYRLLSAAYEDLGVRSEFCKYTIDALLLRAVSVWCMAFGSDGNRVHWKKVLRGECEQHEFRRRFLRATGFEESEWRRYWDGMVVFRNGYVAHAPASGDFPTVPTMDAAVTVVVTYDELVRELIGASFAEPTVEQRYRALVNVGKRGFEEIVRLAPQLDRTKDNLSL